MQSASQENNHARIILANEFFLTRLDGIPDDEIPGLEIPKGVPLVYEFHGALRPTGSRYLDKAG